MKKEYDFSKIKEIKNPYVGKKKALKKAQNKKSDRYLKIVEWSEENQCYVGTCPGLMIGGVHGKNEAQVYKQLCKVVNEWIKIHEADRGARR